MFRLLTERQPLLSEGVSRELRSVKARLGEFEAALEPARKIAATSNKPADHIWLGQLLGVVSRRMRSQERGEEADALLEEAEKEFKQAVIMKMDAPEPWVALIQFYAQSEQLEKAEKTIARARLKLPPVVAATALAQCYQVLNQPDKAEEQYEIAIANAPKDPLVAQSAATFYHRTNQLDRAKVQLVRIIEGDVDANEKQKQSARRTLALILSGEGGSKNREEAIHWIKENLKEDPNSVTDQYLKAVVLANDLTGRHRQEAITSLENLIAAHRNASPQIQFTLAELYRDDGNWREYRLRMDKLLKAYRDVPRYVASYASALTEKGDYAAAELLATELAKLAPNSFQTMAVRAELAFQQRQYERARRLVREYLDSPTTTASEKDKRRTIVAGVLDGFAKRLRVDGEPSWANMFSKEAYDVYRKYIESKPGSELLMASFLARQERLNESIDLIEALWETSNPDSVARACFEVIDGKGASPQQVERVARILQKMAKRDPNALVVQIAIGVLRNQQGRFAEAEEIYREILRRAPDNPTALNNLAVMLARHGEKLKEAAQLIDRAIKQAGPTDDLLDSRAVVRLALDRPEDALDDLQRAIAERPTAMRFFHQAEAFHASGQRKEAISAFKRAMSMGLKEEHLQGVERSKFKRLRVLLQ